MPTPGKRWRHVIVNTRCTWLPGDARGFRNRGHRIHSSGDYRNPPPHDEHEGLRVHNETRAGTPLSIPHALLPIVGRAFVDYLSHEGHRVLALAVTPTHLHALVELPADRARVRSIIGRCKRRACEVIKHELPGRVWSAGGEFKLIRDRDHHRRTYGYILTRQGSDAWTWSFRAPGSGSSRVRSEPGVEPP